jgi:GNAT superfamily N-acetyltransferase
MIQVLQVQPEDVARLVPAARSFFEECKLPGEFNRDTFVLGWMRLLKQDAGLIFALEENSKILGAVGAVINLDLNTGDRIAVEMFYYVLPETRGHALRLLGILEDAARGRGCKRCWMLHLEDGRAERMQKFYERRGYALKEHLYMKELR